MDSGTVIRIGSQQLTCHQLVDKQNAVCLHDEMSLGNKRNKITDRGYIIDEP